MPLGPLGAGIITGLISAAGSYLTNKSSQRFAAGMSGTAYQRAVADMRSAGLNPALAYGQGGASTASPGLEDLGAGVREGASAYRLMKLEVPKVKSEIQYNEDAASAQRAAGTKAMTEAEYIDAERRWLDREMASKQHLRGAEARAAGTTTLWGTVNRLIDGIIGGKSWVTGLWKKLDNAGRRYSIRVMKEKLERGVFDQNTAESVRRWLKREEALVKEGGD